MSEITPELQSVAIAIYFADDNGNTSFAHRSKPMQRRYVEMARAALSAIRTPTLAMHKAASEAETAMSVDGIRRNEHAAMIDYILSDTRTPTEGDLL